MKASYEEKQSALSGNDGDLATKKGQLDTAKKQLADDKHKEAKRKALKNSDQQARIQALALTKNRSATNTDLDTEDSESVYSYQDSEAGAADKTAYSLKKAPVQEEEKERRKE